MFACFCTTSHKNAYICNPTLFSKGTPVSDGYFCARCATCLLTGANIQTFGETSAILVEMWLNFNII